MYITLSTYSFHKGVSLIEVLVSLLIVAVGTLGVAKLQMNNLRDSQYSHYRSQATALAQDLFSRMRGNATVLNDYLVNFNIASTPKDCYQNLCTETEIALWDLYEWRQSLQQNMPTGSDAVLNHVVVDNYYEVTLSWSERNIWDDNTSTPPECGKGLLCISYQARF